MTVLHLELLDEHELYDIIDHAMEDGVKMTKQNFMFVCSNLAPVPQVSTYFVFLEFGERRYDRLTETSKAEMKKVGTDKFHLFVKHDSPFQTGDVDELLNHVDGLSENAFKRRRKSVLLYVTCVASSIFATCVRISGNVVLASTRAVRTEQIQYIINSYLLPGQPLMIDEYEDEDEEVHETTAPTLVKDLSTDQSNDVPTNFSIEPYQTTSFKADGEYAIPEPHIDEIALIAEIWGLSKQYNTILDDELGDSMTVQVAVAILYLNAASIAYRVAKCTGRPTFFESEDRSGRKSSFLCATEANIRRAFVRLLPELWGQESTMSPPIGIDSLLANLAFSDSSSSTRSIFNSDLD